MTDARKKALHRQMNRHANDPTPAEIAERCAEIQAEWCDVVRAARWVQKTKPVDVQCVKCNGSYSGIDFE